MIAEPIKSFAASRRSRDTAGRATDQEGHHQDLPGDAGPEHRDEPLPRKLNPGQTATVSGALAGKLSNPKVQYTDAVGKLERPPPQPGKEFSAELKCGDRPGRILVQIVGQQEGADVLLANFPVGCGIDLPVAAAWRPRAESRRPRPRIRRPERSSCWRRSTRTDRPRA